MIIEKIEIDSFGKLNKIELNLSRGVNIIRGGNESGKSTICNFIVFMFYGLPSDAEEKMKMISWNTSCARGALTVLNDDGKHLRIEREAVCQTASDGKVTFRERCVVFDTETNKEIAKNIAPGELLFGVPELIFADTVYIRQISGTKIGDKYLSEAAENILFSGNEGLNTKKALKKIDDARVFLYHKNKKGGKIYDLTITRDELKNRLDQALQSNNEIISLEGTERQLISSKEISEKRSVELKKDLDLYEAYTVKKSYDRYKAELKAKKAVEDQIDEANASKEFNGAPVYTDEYILSLEKMKQDLQSDADSLVKAKDRLDKAGKKVEEMHAKIEIFEKYGDKHGKRDNLIVLASILNDKLHSLNIFKKVTAISSLFFAVTALGVFVAKLFATATAVNLNTFLIGALVLMGISIVGFVILNIVSISPAKDLKKICKTFGCRNYTEFDELVKAATNEEAILEYITEERNNANAAYIEAEDILNKKNNEILGQLESTNFAIKKTTVQTIDNAIGICKQKRDAINVLKTKLTECNTRIFEIQKTFSSYSDDYVSAACTAEYDEAKLDAYDYQSRRRDYEFLTNSVRAQTEKLFEVQKSLASLRATVEDPTDIANKKSEVDGSISELTDKFEAYQLAYDAMSTASSKLRDGLAPKIAQNASAIMNKLSDGKYDSLSVNADFGMSFKSDAISRSVDFLSAGTSDIAYISLRISLIDVLYRNSIPPFIFDESFMRMDNDRMKNSLKLLCDFGASGTQSLLFTCHGREEKLMRTIGEYTYYTL